MTPFQTETSSTDRPYDAIVIGAGLCGLIFTAHARQRGLNCLVLEKQTDVGGLWNRLPAWQDLQNRRQDFSINGIPLGGVKQPDVHAYAREWVHQFDLEPHIRLGCEVTATSWSDKHWKVHTERGEIFKAANLIVASGVQNEPWIPDVERSDSEIEEAHSCHLQQFEGLKDNRVTVVGGGASSQDLLELAIEHGAQEIHWVCRDQIKWFLPTRRPKQRAWPNLRELGLGQALHGTASATALMRALLKYRYKHYGITPLTPNEPFDFDKHQLIPGRASLLRHLSRVSLHRGEVESMRGRELTLTSGERIGTDRVLWATGYRMNLRYLGLPEYRDIVRLERLFPKLGSLVKARDYPNLFFLGMTLINSTSSTPFLAAVEAKTIISHIQGLCEVPDAPLPHHLTYLDLVSHFAAFDRATYPRGWRLRYLCRSLGAAVLQGRSLRA